MKKTFLLAGILAVSVLGMAETSAKAAGQGAAGKEAVITVKKVENAPEAVALNFINAYYFNLLEGMTTTGLRHSLLLIILRRYIEIRKKP